MPAPINWNTVAATGVRFLPQGPPIKPSTAQAIVADLRRCATRAETHARELTRLDPPGDSQTYVIDRDSWIRANAASFAPMYAMVTQTPGADRPAPPTEVAQEPGTAQGPAMAQSPGTTQDPGAVKRGLGHLNGVGTGTVLALLAPRVLGQYDIFHALDHPQGQGRLLLVAPNIHRVGNLLRVRPRDFRLWVCLHEMTHRVQHGQAPWMVGHTLTLVEQVLTGDRQSKKQATDNIAAMMSVLEGHADVVMDQVGTDVIPTLPQIRKRFEHRRDNQPVAARVLGRLLGADKKLRQYREGAAFTRAVHERVGIDGFNRVFESPQALPTLDELHHPDRWVQRMG